LGSLEGLVQASSRRGQAVFDLLGKAIGKVAERTGQHWARQVVSSVPAQTLKEINKVLGRNFVTKYGAKQGSSCSARWSRSGSEP
jgi:hypothetical protein